MKKREQAFFNRWTAFFDTRDQEKEASSLKAVYPIEWERSCELVAEHNCLTKREKEVMGLLSKGRDTERISEALLISAHTTKAHTHRIYQKLNIHSRQELIDIIEECRI